MSSPDPETFALLSKIVAAAAAVVVPVWISRSWLEKKFSDKMDKEDFTKFYKRFDQHVRDDREVQAKLFDKVGEVKNLLIERLPR